MATAQQLRSPIPWFGGKGNAVRKLLPLIPAHRIYVEPFGGGASLLFAKAPSPVEVYNDLDSDLVNLFRVLRDPEKFERFYRLVALTPYSREEYYHCRDTYATQTDELERAYRFFIAVRQGFSGHIRNGWSYSLTTSNRGMAGAVSRYLSIIEQLPQIHERLMRVQIEHDDYRNVLERYDTPQTFFYLDPPYVPTTRKSGSYTHEMAEEDHRELVEQLLTLKGKVLLSCYYHPVYEPLERAGWKKLDFPTACHAAGRTRGTGLLGRGAALRRQPRTESVFMNYDPSSTLG